jgi:hypothetical protein
VTTPGERREPHGEPEAGDSSRGRQERLGGPAQRRWLARAALERGAKDRSHEETRDDAHAEDRHGGEGIAEES